MKNPSNIAHPLKNRTGTSQRNRVMNALGADSALIDGKTMADRLSLISDYARHVNFYQYRKNEYGDESQELDSWTIFFKDSLPFQLAVLSKTSIDELEAQFLLLHDELKANPSKQSLESLFNFIFNRIVSPVTQLFIRVKEDQNSFTDSLLAIIKTSFSEALKSYISLYNASANFLCIRKKNFIDFINAPWQLKIDEVYALDLCIQQVQNGKKEAFLKAGDILSIVFRQVLSGTQDIVMVAPEYINESLLPLQESLQKKHQPHLALLFTFLELFKHFQGDINELSKEHLDFFYEKVLKLIPKDAIPDQAHIVFELANHKEAYALKKDLLLKDGKDGNNQDIQFGLDHEIVLDKAQIKELRTLCLYPTEAYDKQYIEGVYIAPKANSADGIDKDFKEDQPKNWPTLGDKYSKYIKDGNEQPEEHPKARLGFALSSPVLLLREGRRVIDIRLDCEFEIKDDENEASVIQEMQEVIDCLSEKNERGVVVFKESIFKFRFSGEEEWLEPLVDNITVVPDISGKNLRFDITILLEDDFPAVVFYNQEKLKEKIDVKNLFPLVKIELDEMVMINCTFDNPFGNRHCCLKDREAASTTISFSPYHFLQRLILKDAKIDVEVCGVKNLIVQNDENLQDVNKPMFPFGPRPKVDAAFFIGSKEVFCKNWQSFRVGVEWKDRPEDFTKHYEAYNLEDTAKIDNDIFRIEASVLDNAQWKKENYNELDDLKKVFINRDSFSPCPPIIDTPQEFNFNGYSWNRTDFPLNTYAVKSMPIDPLSQLTVNSRKAFFRMRLKGEDFQHDQYAFVLAKQVMALANIIDAKTAERVREDLRLLELLANRSIVLLGTILGNLDIAIGHIDVLDVTEMPIVLSNARSIQQSLVFVNNNHNHPDSPGLVLDALGKINIILVELDPNVNPATISMVDRVSEVRTRLNLIKGFIEDNPGAPGNTTSIPDNAVDNNLNAYGLLIILWDMKTRIERVTNLLDVQEDAKLPNEPYTPQIKSIFVDYKAEAEKDDMDIIHLYPFKDTSKWENIEDAEADEPTLFPYFDDEGTLFIGLEKITIGGSLSMLFQLAEATANSELDRAQINWHYLSDNEWKPLEYDFKVISDTTDGFTVSGITTIIVPEDINNEGNTVMPDSLYWIKASTPKNVKAIAETIGIHTQAAKTSARFTELNDKKRLDQALEAGSIAKLVEADFNVKKVEQLYPSFGGRTPEANGHFYTRVSEHLKHKGRALMLNDYEKIVLEGFPEIYKAKCITHTMGLSAIDYRRDLEIAPGYAVVTVIPDLTKLKSGNLQEPKVPVSLLEKIGDHIRKRTSPFARLKIMNPRFEFVHVDITVRLYRGKSPNFYKKKLKEDLTLFLAPWSLGDSEKLSFGQVVLYSDIVGFVEQLDYVDFITSLDLTGECDQTGSIIKPLTARSVLTAGEIHVEEDEEKCLGYDTTPNPQFNNSYQSM